MKRCIVMVCTAAVVALPVVAMSTEGESAPAPQKSDGRVVAQTTVAANGVVKAIDMEKRTVTLVLPNGKEQTFVVNEAVRRLGEVKVGDTVNITYHQAVSIRINKTKVTPGVKVTTMIAPDAESAKPAGVTARQVTTTATIDKVFDDGRMVTLRMPDGSTTDVRVRDKENMAKLKSGEVKEGDQIEITYTQALALSVDEAPDKSPDK